MIANPCSSICSWHIVTFYLFNPAGLRPAWTGRSARPHTIHDRFRLRELDQRAVAYVDEVQLPGRLEGIDRFPDSGARNKVAEERFHFLLIGGDYAIEIFGKQRGERFTY